VATAAAAKRSARKKVAIMMPPLISMRQIAPHLLDA